MSPLRIEFAGEWFSVEPGDTFTIGRDGDLRLDDNPYLHRRFLVLSWSERLWWLANDGSRLAATLTDARGLVRSWLAPGARTPLVFAVTVLTFSAGPTTYEVHLHAPDVAFEEVARPHLDSGQTTIGATTFTESQKLLILALAEPMLRRAGTGTAQIPASAAAARRLGWTQTRFNRKLDNVCDKLDQMGVRGLRGDTGRQATNRRTQLVEYAITSLLVTADDLPLLEAEARANRQPPQQVSTTGGPR